MAADTCPLKRHTEPLECLTLFPHKSSRSSGFWQINTASHVDWAQQSRLIEPMNNRDGTLSIFTTILDQAAPS